MLTERGRWASALLDERGRKVTGSLTEQGQKVFGAAAPGTGTPGSASYATKQVINQSGSTAYATKQAITQTASVLAATKQTIYQTASVSYATQQTITDGGIPGVIAYSTKQVIYQVSSIQLATKQAIYSIGFSDFATKQIIMEYVSIGRSVNLFASMVEAINLLGESVAPVNLQASWISSISLLGSNPEPIALEGGLMTKLKQDFTMFAGDTPPLTFTMSDSTSLSGATVKWVMRKGHVKGPQALLKTTLNGGLVASGTIVTVNLLSADTLSLEGKFYHEAEVTDVSGKVSTVMTGTITIEPSGV
jgi:hypothetical protein